MHKSHKKNKRRNVRHGSSSSSKMSNSDLTTDGDSDTSVHTCGSCKDSLKPYEVRTSDIMGRYLVASWDLPAGSSLMSESPLAIGPCAGMEPACLGCYRTLPIPLPDNQYLCPGCRWPICGARCPGIGSSIGHSTAECTILKTSKSGKLLNLKDDNTLRDDYEAITPLRCLLLHRNCPSQWTILQGMESHNKIRKSITAVWQHNQEIVVNTIRHRWGLKHFSEEEIHNVCGILEVNAFEVGQNGIKARALYPSAFLLAHDCTPNTSHTDQPDTFKLTVRASTPIARGDSITLSYAHTLQGTLLRRENILESKFFECRCHRCSDPTELGTYVSALQCPKCPSGLVLSDDPLNTLASWTCGNCSKYSVTEKSMRLLMDRIFDELDSIDCNDVDGFESFLERYRNVLHPNHYLCLSAKHSLSQLYGKAAGFVINCLTPKLLLRKQEICSEIMNVFDVLEPGLTRLRGITLYELHAPLMIRTTRDFEAKNISVLELKVRLKEVMYCLKQADIILSLEPPNSAEAMMASAAKDALHRIKDWQKIIGKF